MIIFKIHLIVVFITVLLFNEAMSSLGAASGETDEGLPDAGGFLLQGQYMCWFIWGIPDNIQ